MSDWKLGNRFVFPRFEISVIFPNFLRPYVFSYSAYGELIRIQPILVDIKSRFICGELNLY